jgi:pyruvate dehydrogenase E1 component alpha subunit/2-oxoisovalerate dehydrogenase E1 component alpha subunit
MAHATSAAPTPAGPFAYFELDPVAKAKGLFQLLREDGTPVDEAALAQLDRALARQLFEGMLRIRVTDARMMALQRQGRIGFYGEAMGQEAAVVGSAAATAPDDWIVPALREAGVGLYRGMTLDSYIAQIFGNAADPTKGRQMPCHPCDRAHNYVVMSSCVSTQIPHAVGIALAMKIQGHTGRACFGYMGDGGTSEGDFHEALNFAAVWKLPVVFVCENNLYGMSMSVTEVSRLERVAERAAGYGIPGVTVDGNDVDAVHKAAAEAVAHARSGQGPTLVEAVTYRWKGHSKSDQNLYRTREEIDSWRARDPIERFEQVVLKAKTLSEDELKQVRDQARDAVRDAVRAGQTGPPPSPDLLAGVYAPSEVDALSGGEAR